MSNVRLNGWLGIMLLALAMGAMGMAHAAEPQPTAADPVLEARVMAIAAELRCLVCQNQTIADSSAELAVDLRRQVREMLQHGKSQRDILDFMTARYGDFVLYRPPLKGSTVLLWVGPFALLIGGVALLAWVLRRRTRLAAEQFDADVEDSVPAA